MSAHTPGPWKVWDRGIGWEVHAPNGWAVNSGHRETFSEADARLIAAAPDLLAVLKLINIHGYRNISYHDMVLEAIAKAEGKA